MKKVGFRTFFLVLVLSMLLVSCGKINFQQSHDLAKDLPYFVLITVDISSTADPVIYVKAKEIKVDQNKMEVTVIGESFISDNWDKDSLAIKIESTKFSVPLGGTITIWKDGKKQILERY